MLLRSSFTLTTSHCTGSEVWLTSGSTPPANSTRTLGLMAYSEEEIWMTKSIHSVATVLNIQDERGIYV